jgi:hypothetical protein
MDVASARRAGLPDGMAAAVHAVVSHVIVRITAELATCTQRAVSWRRFCPSCPQGSRNSSRV